MALSYTQKTSDNSLITKYVRKDRPASCGCTQTCADRNPCTSNSALTLSRMVCTWEASFPLTVTLESWRTKQISPSRCAFCPTSYLADSPTHDLDPASLSSLSSRSRLHLRSSEFSGITTRAKSLTYAALSPCH